jgi:hypothetical protein
MGRSMLWLALDSNKLGGGFTAHELYVHHGEGAHFQKLVHTAIILLLSRPTEEKVGRSSMQVDSRAATDGLVPLYERTA